MNRYFIYLSYDGARYHGWQRQPNGSSVEETVERSLSLLLRRDVNIVGAGRTDTGVNASSMPAHFDVESDDETLFTNNSGETFVHKLQYKLNRILPADIAVQKIVRVRPDAHARFDAVERTYYYYITTEKNPFRVEHYYRIPFDVDFGRMNEAADLLVRKGDFASFAKTNSDVKTTICDVRRAVWVDLGDNAWRFEITADRFLRNMVRAVVGTLLDVGRGRMQPSDMENVLRDRNRCAAGESVFGGALFLHEVKYPANVFDYELP